RIESGAGPCFIQTVGTRFVIKSVRLVHRERGIGAGDPAVEPGVHGPNVALSPVDIAGKIWISFCSGNQGPDGVIGGVEAAKPEADAGIPQRHIVVVVLLMPDVAANLDGVSSLLPAQVVVSLEVRIETPLRTDREFTAGDALEVVIEVALRRYIKAGRLGTKARPGI